MTQTQTSYKIRASINKDQARAVPENVLGGNLILDGYCVHNYFACDLDAMYETREQAELAARESYKGADVDGVGCGWEIVEA